MITLEISNPDILPIKVEILRKRFLLSELKAVIVSQIIGATKEDGWIKSDESESTSTRYARYLPFWA